ncbi:MAG: hypothetical protein AVO39_02750 [delta proteobacterium MLS_D]|jgi:hypothetical protein|nr:MAG: hypothetical protein AVO39_02750 [delta proteobacterium MLS_D]
MGRKSVYNFNKRNKEKARQEKQMEKAAKRLLAKQNKTRQETLTLDGEPGAIDPATPEETGKVED